MTSRRYEVDAMRRLTITTVLICLAVAAGPTWAATPVEVITDAVELLTVGLDARKDEFAEDKDALYAFIDGILLPRFDREFAAGAVLGTHWRTATDEQKSRFIAAFYSSLVHRYADGILEFDTDRVEILPFRGAPKRTATVKTNVRLDDSTKVPVHYTLVNREDKWRMFNVTIEGVSYVRNYKMELDSQIRDSGLEKVIQRLETEAGLVASE
ncbi:MAG: ABC transporter substrate-binding protein [Gammaproteobacteria bacterium]|nr:ABC transporter substrate-binding protein [Gammaproteobacteria bacterium]MDH3416397.1 ABC transporter substrate-binding protein [Gammaproteobacteria bacterium]